MAKYCGHIGYVKSMEIQPGVWDYRTTERLYYGDVIRNTSRFQPSGSVNDDININNVISVVADPYAKENFQYMRYIEFMGTKWKITNVEIQYPRISLTIGGVYNG